MLLQLVPVYIPGLIATHHHLFAQRTGDYLVERHSTDFTMYMEVMVEILLTAHSGWTVQEPMILLRAAPSKVKGFIGLQKLAVLDFGGIVQ